MNALDWLLPWRARYLIKGLEKTSQEIVLASERLQRELKRAQSRARLADDAADELRLEHYAEKIELQQLKRGIVPTPDKGKDPKAALKAVDNLQASGVAFRQVITVNKDLRQSIRNIIINLAYAKSLPAGSNAAGEIWTYTMLEATKLTNLTSIAEAARIGKEQMRVAPVKRGFEPEETKT